MAVTTLAPRASEDPGGVRVLEARGISKAFGRQQALDHVDLALEPGQIVGLLGQNGAGKTTLASVIAGLIQPDAGTLSIDGVDALRRPASARRQLGFAPQSTGIYGPLTVEQNLKFFGELTGLARGELRDRIAAVSRALLLEEVTTRRCQTLSGGQKRRLHTAIALLSRPRLLVLDEPTVGADVETRRALLEVVRDLASEGSSILYTTHYLPEIEDLEASVVLLERGRVIAQGNIDELIAKHGEARVELVFEGSPPVLVLDGSRIEREGSSLRITTGTPGPTAARALASLGHEENQLRSVKLLQPSLESVFLGLTGRRYRSMDEV